MRFGFGTLTISALVGELTGEEGWVVNKRVPPELSILSLEANQLPCLRFASLLQPWHAGSEVTPMVPEVPGHGRPWFIGTRRAFGPRMAIASLRIGVEVRRVAPCRASA